MRPFRKAIYYENIHCQLEENFEENEEKTRNTTIMAIFKNTKIEQNLLNITEEATTIGIKNTIKGKLIYI